MSSAPENPKIYHITHGRNLNGILQVGGLWSDAQMIQQGVKFHNVGMPHIKRRRLEDLTVSCHPPTKVGDYVPFYFARVPLCSTS